MLTADRNTPMKDAEVIAVPISANAIIYAGAMVCANATGFAVRGDTNANLTYLGRSQEHIDNTGGADGAKEILVRRGKAFFYKNDGGAPVTQAGLGKTCYIVDDETVAATNGGGTRSACGVVVGLDASGVWVE